MFKNSSCQYNVIVRIPMATNCAPVVAENITVLL